MRGAAHACTLHAAASSAASQGQPTRHASFALLVFDEGLAGVGSFRHILPEQHELGLVLGGAGMTGDEFAVEVKEQQCRRGPHPVRKRKRLFCRAVALEIRRSVSPFTSMG